MSDYVCLNLPFGLSDKEKKDFKKQYWFLLIYEDSVKENYIDLLSDYGYKIVISPWHDKDINEDGQFKKKHRHVLIDFGGPARISQVGHLAEHIGAVLQFKWVGNKKWSYEYLTHKNDLDKYQYDPRDLVYVNSKSYDWLTSAFKDILDYIDDHKCKTLVTLTKQLRKDGNDYLLEYVSKNSYYVSQYLRDIKDGYDKKLSDLSYYLSLIYKDIENEKFINKDEKLKALRDRFIELGFDGLDYEM